MKCMVQPASVEDNQIMYECNTHTVHKLKTSVHFGKKIILITLNRRKISRHPQPLPTRKLGESSEKGQKFVFYIFPNSPSP